MEYTLMHREKRVAEIELDELSNIIAVREIYSPEHLPVGTVGKFGADRKALAKWWAKRSIPASRSGLREALDALNLSVPQELLSKCCGLSLSDQYWISPADAPLSWQEVNFFDNAFSDDVGNLLFGHKKAEGGMDLVSPDNTSDGQLVKKWKISGGKRVLVKGASRPYRQEALCEVIASKIAERLGIKHVRYDLIWESGEPFSVCDDFITPETELVSAHYVMRTAKKPNDMSDCEFYIQCAEALGAADVREQLEKMLTLDFIIANEDRHYNNFGLVRNAVTLECLGTAPVFDCGTSLWYNTQESLIKPLSPSLPSKPFRKTHGEQIGLVSDFSWLDLNKLDGIEDEARSVLSSSPYIGESRCEALCGALKERIGLLSDIVRKHENKNSFGLDLQ